MDAIKKVYLEKGKDLPLRIQVEMTESAGFFQVEEVLMKKIGMIPVKKHIEFYAGVVGQNFEKIFIGGIYGRIFKSYAR